MNTLRFSFFWAAMLAICATATAQNQPISLSTEVSTTYYTDGSADSKSRMLFYVGDGPAQRMGFIGGRLKPHLNEAPEVQANYKAFRAWGAASQTWPHVQRNAIAAIFAEDPTQIRPKCLPPTSCTTSGHSVRGQLSQA